ncbi:hypothetical protein GCM10010289_44390 [Streptomyces violascens]|uniref:Uncharacterized protein n=1 Tax=Streptomyces violascens TaxID=67381 RepID=A0ABQ3QXM2_9ACTN|nr:hypothetical protein GCM10010289_44390 [Streptomyces violascens]GHI42031.1 hypothetical protein Sviol_64390 [Streptomyces violascens]
MPVPALAAVYVLTGLLSGPAPPTIACPPGQDPFWCPGAGGRAATFLPISQARPARILMES